MNKEELRKYYKQKRDELYKAGCIFNISDSIVKKIAESEYFKSAKNIMLFYPKGSELNLLELLKFKDKNFYMPVCKEGEIVVCPYKEGDKLILNGYGIYEPETSPVKDLSIFDIIITPALCADINCQRIGYGKGYYDRFFANKNLKAKKIIVVPKECLVNSIPCEHFDKPCDLIITQDKTIEDPKQS